MLRCTKLCLLTCFIATTAAAGVTQKDSPGPSRPLTVTEQRIIEAVVKDELLDPDAAKFRMGSLMKASSRYCGLVNMKNRLGGYVGYWTFSVDVKKDAKGRVVSAGNPFVQTGDMFGREVKPALDCYEDGYPSTWTQHDL